MKMPIFRAPIVAPFLLLSWLFAGDVARALDAAQVGHAEVILELPPGGPIEGEMVLLKFRAVVHGLAALDDLRQPALNDLDWKQLGRDQTSETQFKGFPARGFERTIAIFPQRNGTITIDAFVYHLTMIDRDGSRVEIDLTSAPVNLDVRPLPALAKEARWLPAKSVSVSDTWDKKPTRLAFGETVRRTVTIEAEGIGAEHLPPPPLMRAPGVISFAGPVERSTRLTPTGPVARAVYRWDIRPISRNAATLPAFPIRWFDTINRQVRETVIPEQKISLAAAFGGAEPREDVRSISTSPWHLASVGFGSLIWGLAALYLFYTRGRGSRPLKSLGPVLLPLRVAARADNARDFRGALSALMQADPRAAFICTQDAGIKSRIAALDSHLFAATARPHPPLMQLYREIETGLRQSENYPRTASSAALAPLDGPMRERATSSTLQRFKPKGAR
jgi:hypothetical protein